MKRAKAFIYQDGRHESWRERELNEPECSFGPLQRLSIILSNKFTAYSILPMRWLRKLQTYGLWCGCCGRLEMSVSKKNYEVR